MWTVNFQMYKLDLEKTEEPGIKLSTSAAAAAAAKPLQSCLTLYDSTDGSLPGSPVPGILQARTLEWVAISFSNAWKWKVKVKSLSHARLLATPWTAAYQAPPSMGFFNQQYWSGLPLPSPQHPLDHRKSKRVHRNIYFCLIDYAKAFDCVDHHKLENSERYGNTRPPGPTSWKICIKVKKQQLELDMEQQTGSK